MDIAAIREFTELFSVLDQMEDERLLIWCDETSAGSRVHNIAAALYDAPAHEKAAILIGPEGGFSDNDITMLKKYNWRIISLGDRILRTETACVVAQTLMRKW